MSYLDKHESVKQFHKIYNCYTQENPGLPNEEIRDLRRRLLKEEYEEYLEGEETDDLVEIADALADMLYIMYGTALAYGIPLDEIFDEVHRSNLSKLGADGKPIVREDGKILKGPDFFKPDIAKIMGLTGQDV